MKLLSFLTLFIFFYVTLTGQNTGDFRSAVVTGNWNTNASWERYNGSDWVVPGAGVYPGVSGQGGQVLIRDGHTITLNYSNVAALAGLTVGEGVSGSLVFDGTARTLNVSAGSVTVSPGASLSAGTSAIATHSLLVGGNLAVEGTFNLNTTAKVSVTFSGNSNNTISGSGTIGFYAVTVNKGTGTGQVLEATAPFTMNAPAAAASRLTLTNGTLKISSAVTATPWFGTQTLCAAGGRLWLNHPSANFSCVGTGTATGAGNATVTGSLQVDAGTFAYGSGNNLLQVDGTLILGGSAATVNIYGRVAFGTSSVFTMTDGNFNVDPQAANLLAGASHIVGFASTSLQAVTFTGGTLTVVDPQSTTGTGATVVITAASGGYNFLGSTIRFGDGVSNAEGSTEGFELNGGTLFTLGHVELFNAPSSVSTKRLLYLAGNTKIGGNLVIHAGTANVFRNSSTTAGMTLYLAGNLVNDGTYHADGYSACTLVLNGATQQTFGGAGVITNGNIRKLTVDNTSGAIPAVDFQAGFSVSDALTLSNGVAGSTNSSVMTIGKSATATTLAVSRSAGSVAMTTVLATSGITTWNCTYGTGISIPAITTGPELPAAITGTLTINNPVNGVVLSAPLSAGLLVLTSGPLTTTGASLLTVTGTTAASVTGGSASSWVNGPLARTLPNNATAATYAFPVGKSGYNGFDLVSLTTGGTGTGLVRAEVFDAAPTGGTPGAGLSTIADPAARYWQITPALGSVTLTSFSPRLSQSGMTNGVHKIGTSSAEGGVYTNAGGTVAADQVTGNSAASLAGYYLTGAVSAVTGTYDVGASQPVFKKLGDVAAAVCNTTLTGDLVFELAADFNGADESLPVTFTPPTFGAGGPYTVTIRPKTGVTGKSVTGNHATAIIDLNGADYIIFDGRPGGTGAPELTIENTGTAGSTIRLTNDATFNTLRYLTLKGGGGTSTGVITFINTATGTGLVDNLVEYCNITKGAGGLPYAGIYSYGNATKRNAGTIRNNYISDFRRNAIFLDYFNGAWEIAYNSIFMTEPTPELIQYIIQTSTLQNENCMVNIHHNTIGGSAPDNSGLWVSTGNATMYGIYIGLHSTTLPGYIADNTVKNVQINGTTGTIFGAIFVLRGLVHITNNLVTDLSSPVTTNAGLQGIRLSSFTNGCTIIGNTVRNLVINSPGGTDLTATISASAFTGIMLDGQAQNLVVSDNVVHNLSRANTGQVDASVVGIELNTQSSTGIVTRNRVYDLFVLSTKTVNAKQAMAGIRITYGIWTVSNNQVSLTNGTNTNFCRVFGVIDNSWLQTTNSANTNWYFNSVYVGGTPGESNAYSAAFACYSGNARTVRLRNNIFYNERTNTGTATGNHYAYYMGVVPVSFTTNYNMLVPQNAATVAYNAGVDKTFAAWQAVAGYDLQSIYGLNTTYLADTLFLAKGGGNLNIAIGYPVINNMAVTGTGVTVDYNNTTRAANPDIGSCEFSSFAGVITGSPATSVTTTGAVVPGTVSPANESVTGVFEYGPTPAYGQSVAWSPAPVTGTAPVGVSATLSGLLPGTLYHYRITGVTPAGTSYGEDHTFTTESSVPTAFNVTGGGTYCAGGPGLPVGVAESENGVTYELILNGVPTGITVPGNAGNPVTFGNRTAGSYTVSGTNPSGTTMMTGFAVITEIPQQTPLAFIQATQTTVCQGTPVSVSCSTNFTPTAYDWYVNGTLASHADTLTFTPSDGDLVYCVAWTGAGCWSSPSAATDTLEFTVDPVIPVSVTIIASSNPAAQDSTITFTAIPENTGLVTILQWQVNGINVGSGGTTYTYVPGNNDTVTCLLYSTVQCPSAYPAVSNIITVVVLPVEKVVAGTFTGPGDTCFSALFTVTTGGPGNPVEVLAGAGLNLVAGLRVRMLPETRVHPGGWLHAYIDDSPICLPPPPVAQPAVITGGVERLETAHGDWVVYPNPTSGAFRIEQRSGELPGSVAVRITSMHGRTVHSGTYSWNGSRAFELKGTPPGLYVVTVTADGRQENFRVILVP